MRRPLVTVPFVTLLVGALAATLAACFSPLEPACAFSCGPGGACPAAYTCASDGLCHREDGRGQCTISPQDAGSETGP